MLVGLPDKAHASLFSQIVKAMGSDAQAQSANTTDSSEAPINNSQTVPLLESSINPDIKNIKEVVIVAPSVTSDTISSDNAPIPDTDSGSNYSSAEIKIYTVKKGDTLEGIAKKFNISKADLTDANTNLKKTDLLKIGQKLAILSTTTPLSVKVSADAKSDDSDTKTDTTKKIAAKDTPVVTAPKDTAPTPAPQMYSINIDNPPVTAGVQTQTPTVSTDTTVASGQPEGSIADNYIWPFPKGVGRVSQGLHDDQAYDFAAPLGTPIYAVHAGTVLIVHPTGYNGGFGKYVVINFDDGRQAIFGHMTKTIAVEGQIVKQGDIIGLVGSTGASTGPHVHIGFHGTLGNPYTGLKVNSTDIDHD